MDSETLLFYTYNKQSLHQTQRRTAIQLTFFSTVSLRFKAFQSGGKNMIIDSTRLNGPCSCGREHIMVTKEAVIEAGCMEKLDFYASKYGLTGQRAVVYDENTHHAKNIVRPKAAQEIVLNPENLHANEIAVGDRKSVV